jgi:uncharacterized membrane protein
MKKILSLSLVTLVLFGLFSFTNVFAYEEGDSSTGFGILSGHIVPCGKSSDIGTSNENCTLCHLFVMLKNIFDLLFALTVIVSILLITISGVVYIVSTGNPSITGQAKGIIKGTLTGFVLMMAGWLLVFFLLSALSTSGSVPIGSGSNWYEFTCNTTP